MARVLTFKHPDQEPVIIELDRWNWRAVLLTVLLSFAAGAAAMLARVYALGSL